MKDEILTHINNPNQLEKMYRSSRSNFRKEFVALYPELKGNALADFWYTRLTYERTETYHPAANELAFILVASFIAGCIANIPDVFSIDHEFFYPRNIGFILFPVLAAYFAWKSSLSVGKTAVIAMAMLTGLVFINLLPRNNSSDTLILSCMHLVLFLWFLTGIAFAGTYQNNPTKRMAFLQYNGDLVVITTLIAISGGILIGISLGLFELIGINIEEYYLENIVSFGAPAAPILGTYLIQTNPQLVGKISPVIAKIFSPLVLVMLVIYLTAIIFSGKDPYNDRDFLLIFNALLIGVMAIIFFSIAESSKTTKTKAEVWVLFLLSVVTVVVNGIALSAILFRISEWGITPNRAAVLGSNGLILINLLLVTVQLFMVLFARRNSGGIGRIIAGFLPVYFVWIIVVTFLFPVLFGFR